MEYLAKLAIFDSVRLLQALQSVHTIEVSLLDKSVHTKET